MKLSHKIKIQNSKNGGKKEQILYPKILSY